MKNKKVVPFHPPVKNNPKKVSTHSIKDVIKEIEEVQEEIRKVKNK